MREVEQMRALGIIKLQGAGERLEDPIRDTAHVAALEPGVVGNAHAREDRDFLAAQAGNPAGAVIREPDLLRC